MVTPVPAAALGAEGQKLQSSLWSAAYDGCGAGGAPVIWSHESQKAAKVAGGESYGTKDQWGQWLGMPWYRRPKLGGRGQSRGSR